MATQNDVGVIKYAVWDPIFEREKPFKIMSDLGVGTRKTNITYKDGPPQLFRDVRGDEARFSLDANGFKFCRHVFPFHDWYDAGKVEAEYFPKVKDLLRREIPGVTRVEIFDWRLRRNQTFEEAGIDEINLNDSTHWLPPVSTAHIDQTLRSTQERVRYHLKSDAEALMRGRVRIINVWRPINHPIEDWPLAVCDASNVIEDDLLKTDYVTLDYIGETYNVIYRDKYNWHYLSRQTPEEVTLLKISDSNLTTKATCCPHASFQHSNTREDALPRESIEVRALVFSKD